ncbi:MULTISPECIES: GNAT family N-acetyltransferase [Microbacterium]|uniref:GNAT family N-acetyltransferase n=1 Tax=Microbacterium TaxID=33882 RepID=UPI00277F4F5A|nr:MULTISPECIES: GNAT family N-acetyltransferase [Microbacterium]MDQ1084497.1 ribosomal protein S18 acetylase RimI-like enzyme [Microbacterium sp. SORGH_AS_0344]MDQ1170226.1 ribosomal protein S18 acetylase RimI-like enzyme [Microbacterium proteolyticum]
MTTSDTLEIRPAHRDDAELIATVHATSWRETYGRFVDDPETSPWFAVDRRIGMWRENLDQDAFTTLVARIDDEVVGFAAVQAVDDPAAARAEELAMLYVLARAHGCGAGQALLDAVLGDRPAQLWVAADNPRAHAFYRRNGFHPDGAESSFGPIPRTVRLVR